MLILNKKDVLAAAAFCAVMFPVAARADVSRDERLDADCIDRANAHLPVGAPFMIRGSAGVEGNQSPILSPRFGSRLELEADWLRNPRPESFGLVLGLDGAVIYSPSATGYSLWLTAGLNRREYVVHSTADVVGECQMYRYDLRLFGGPWVNALTGVSPWTDARLGGIAGLMYRQRRRFWGFEVALAGGLTYDLVYPDESTRMWTWLGRVGGRLGPFYLGTELRYTGGYASSEVAGSAVLGLQVEL